MSKKKSVWVVEEVVKRTFVINNGEDEQEIRTQNKDDDDDYEPGNVFIEAPCGSDVTISKDEYVALRSALDKMFELNKK